MTQAYGSIPSSAIVDIPSSIPSGMLYRIKQIQGCNREQVKMVAVSGQGAVRGGQKVIVQLPPNSLVDLSTFEMIFNGYTDHNGNIAAGNINRIVQARYFPRNIQSIIDSVDIKINGKSVQRIDQYGYIYNIFHDFNCGDDSLRKNKIGQNADPSSKTWNWNGLTKRKNLYPIGIFTGDNNSVITRGTAKDFGTYSIRQWLGLLGGNGSTSIIHTGMMGEVQIEITLAGGGVLCQSSAPNALTTYTNQTGIDTANMIDLNTLLNGTTAAYTTTGPVASEGNNYTLDNISFNITKYSMPDTFYNAMASVLASGQTYQIYFPNYSVYQGIPSTTKTSTTRFSIATKSLDMCIGTFQLPNRDTIGLPILGGQNYNTYATSFANALSGEEGLQNTSLDTLINFKYPLTFNSSRYFVRNGDLIQNARWLIGGTPMNSENILEMYNGVLRAFNSQNDMVGGLYKGCCSLNHFRSQFFAHILKLSAQTENDAYTVSGVNCMENSLDITWETTGGDPDMTNPDTRLLPAGNTGAIPVIIACYSSHIDISANRNIVYYT